MHRQNNDEYCFQWAIISALYPMADNSNKITSYNVVNIEDEIIRLENNTELNFKNLNFNQIKVFETSNPEMSDNVFALDNKNNIVGSYCFSQQEKYKHINLLLLEDGEKLQYKERNIYRHFKNL